MLTKVVKVSGGLVWVLSVALLATGCKHKSEDVVLQPDLTTTGGPTNGNGDPNALPDIGADRLFGPTGLQKVYFEYNSYALSQEALTILQRNADMLRASPGIVVQVEGHCDDRGTQEYNLALGEKRALATREQLIKLGIPADHIVTISYGEEMPAMQGTGESVWSQNRRCEFNKAM